MSVNILNELGNIFSENREFENAMKYANEALTVSQKLKFARGEATARRTIGLTYAKRNEYPEAEINLQKALRINEGLGNISGIAQYYDDIGFLCYLKDDDPGALKNYYTALKLYEKLKDSSSIASLLNRIGNTYYYLQKHSESENNYRKALSIFEKIGDMKGIAYSNKSIGISYLIQGDVAFEKGDAEAAKIKYDLAIERYSVAVKIYEDLALTSGLMETYPFLGNVYERLGSTALQGKKIERSKENFSLALNYYLAFMELARKQNDHNYLNEAFNLLGGIYIKLKNYSLARKFLEKSLAIAVEKGYIATRRDVYGRLVILDSVTGNFEDALKNYKLFIEYRDSLINQENTRKAEHIKLQYEFDKKEEILREQHLLAETRLLAQKKQRFFYWGGLIMLAGLLFFVFLSFRNQRKINRLNDKAYTQKKKDMELQHQNVVMNERLRISRELHDEVGATLSGIAMYSHLAKEQIKNNKATEVEKSLNVMQQSSGEMVNKLNDIVWLVNPDQDNLQKLIERLEEYVTNMAAIKSMQVKINIPETISQVNLPMESRRNIYLFCKEAINNAVKYSGGNLLELNIKEADGKLEFSVSDDGKGFDVVMVRRGNGLENMQKRADEIGAKLIVLTKQNEGVSLSMEVKLR